SPPRLDQQALAPARVPEARRTGIEQHAAFPPPFVKWRNTNDSTIISTVGADCRHWRASSRVRRSAGFWTRLRRVRVIRDRRGRSRTTVYVRFTPKADK